MIERRESRNGTEYVVAHSCPYCGTELAEQDSLAVHITDCSEVRFDK